MIQTSRQPHTRATWHKSTTWLRRQPPATTATAVIAASPLNCKRTPHKEPSRIVSIFWSHSSISESCLCFNKKLCHIYHLNARRPINDRDHVHTSISTVGLGGDANGQKRADWPVTRSTGDAATPTAWPFPAYLLPLPLPCRDEFCTPTGEDSRIYLVWSPFLWQAASTCMSTWRWGSLCTKLYTLLLYDFPKFCRIGCWSCEFSLTRTTLLTPSLLINLWCLHAKSVSSDHENDGLLSVLNTCNPPYRKNSRPNQAFSYDSFSAGMPQIYRQFQLMCAVYEDLWVYSYIVMSDFDETKLVMAMNSCDSIFPGVL